MSFTINGKNWQPRTAAEHAQTMLASLNTRLKAAGIEELVASSDNAAWQILLAAGAIQQEFDQSLLVAASSFNISACDDAQLLNLLPISGLVPLEAKRSVVSITIKTGADALTIPAGAGGQTDDGDNFIFDQFVRTSGTVAPNTTIVLTATADTPGAIIAKAGTINKLTVAKPDSVTVSNTSDAILGYENESPAATRRRLLDRQRSEFIPVYQAAAAISGLLGVLQAKVYFNPSIVDNLDIGGGLLIPPRQAFIVILGQDDQGLLAKSFYQYMDCLTLGGTGFLQSKVSIKNTQEFTANYKVATEQPLYVRVYYDTNKPTSPGFADDLKDKIVSIKDQVVIGQTITAQWIDDFIDKYPYADITGVEISLTENSGFDRAVAIDADKYASFALDRITIIGENA